MKPTECYENILKNTKSINTWYVFLFICGIALVNTWIIENYIMTLDFYTNTLSDRMEVHRIEQYYLWMKGFSKWQYAIIPLFILLRITLVTLMIQLPFVIKLQDIPFSKIFRVATLSLFSLIILNIVQTIFVIQMPSSDINQDSLSLIPLSIAALVDINKYSRPFYNLLGSFNIFELIWCFMVYLGLSRYIKVNKYDSVSIVISVWAFIEIFKFLLMSYLSRIYT